MKVELSHEEVELEISQGERGGSMYEDKVYVYLDLGDEVCEGYIDRNAFDKLALAFSAAREELST